SWIDSALSVGIGALILWSGFGIVRETLNILLEGTPRGIKLERVETAIRTIEGVNDVHDLHIWSIGSETRALSCHIAIADIPPSVSERILRVVKDRLHRSYRIDHTTIQFEHVECEVADGCVMPVDGAEHHQSHWEGVIWDPLRPGSQHGGAGKVPVIVVVRLNRFSLRRSRRCRITPERPTSRAWPLDSVPK